MPFLLRSSRRAALVAGAAALAVGLAACGGTTKNSTDSANTQAAAPTGTANPNAPYKTGLNIDFVPRQVNNPYETIADNGGLAALKELGENGSANGPSDAGASSQVPYLNTAIQQKADGIVVAANDQNALCPTLKQAMAQGTKVVTFDADVAPGCRQLFINQADSETIGRSEVQILAKQLNYTGEIAILSATASSTNQNAWIGYMKDELAKPEYKNMKLDTIVYGNDDDQTSFQQTQGLLQAYPNLKGIISPTTVGIAAAARYIDGSSYKGKVVLTGLGTPNQMRQYVKDGTVTQFELWDPANLGYLAAYAVSSLASGQITGAQGQTFKAGKLGTYTIGANGEVILGPPTVFNAQNIDQYNF